VSQKLTLLKGGEPLPAEVVATEAQLTGSVRYLADYVSRMLKLTPAQVELIRPGFETLDLAIGDKIEDWNQVFLHILEELRQKGVELEQREALLQRMRRDGRTLLYRRELGEERLLTTLREEHRGNGFGIEMVDVRLRRADLPEQTSQAIYDRMKSERNREAKEARGQGEELKLQIRARADREKIVLLAEAAREAQIVRGEGDATAIKIYADAFGKDPQFFGFYRSMQAYATALANGDTTMILSPGLDFLRYLNDPSGNAKPAQK